jgi:enamine deaminase RidA (YjgF/YER057c/UK114 family)
VIRAAPAESVLVPLGPGPGQALVLQRLLPAEAAGSTGPSDGRSALLPPAAARARLGLRAYRAAEDPAYAAPALLWAGPADPASGRPGGAANDGPSRLPPDSACVDLWWTDGSVAAGSAGCVQFAGDGAWLLGTARIDDGIEPGGLAAAAERLYRDLFGVLEQQGCPHLVRLWNYFAQINAAAGERRSPAQASPDPERLAAVERYRLFNVGRQRAFIAARRSAFEGAPAACALGTRGGPLTVHFLAGRSPARPVENPRQVSAYHYPRGYGPRSPTFSRAALADLGAHREGLFISGTASIVGHESRHPGDVRRQTAETLANIGAVIHASAAVSRARHTVEALDYTVYVRHAADLAEVQAVFEEHFGRGSAAVQRVIYLRADICRPDLLVEIEAHGSADTGAGS